MESKEFKRLFGGIAVNNGFEFHYGGWFRETPACIVTLELQKSNYSNYYYMNVNVHIHRSPDDTYSKSKQLLYDAGDFSTRQPAIYDEAFDLENILTHEQRKKILLDLFEQYLAPMVKQLISLESIKKYVLEEKYPLFPPLKKVLQIPD